MKTALLAGRTVAPPPPAEPPVWRGVLGLAWPAVAQNALLAVVALFDRWLAGQASSHEATSAAQTTATYLSWFLLTYSMLVTGGSTTLVAYLVGAGERRNALH